MFYKKHLQDLAALQTERAALKKKAKKKAEALSKVPKQDGENSILTKGISFVTGSFTGNSTLGGVADIGLKLALPYLVRKGAQAGIRKIAGNVAKEVAFGYIKWKALSIAAGIIAKQVKKKTKREAV